jgi:hypothetical protein
MVWLMVEHGTRLPPNLDHWICFVWHLRCLNILRFLFRVRLCWDVQLQIFIDWSPWCPIVQLCDEIGLMTNMPLYRVHNVPKCCWTFETFLWWRYLDHISAHNINPRTQKHGIMLLSLIVLPICCWEKLLLIILDWLMSISTHAHTSFWHKLVTQKWPKG